MVKKGVSVLKKEKIDMHNSNFEPNDNFLYYLYFIKERMNIFWRKQNGEQQPWTEDPILANHKFTNVYRILDRSSQYLISDVLYNGNKYTPEDIFWRVFLYKNYNLPSTWEHLKKDLGDITFETKLSDISKSLDALSAKGKPVYSNAYLLTCPFMRKASFLEEYNLKSGSPKYTLYLSIFRKDLFEKGIFERCMNSDSFESLYTGLRGVLSFADFLSYQIAQDLNYSELFDFDMNKFNAAGPGTIRGIERTFNITGKINYGDVPVWVYENFDRLVEEYSNKFDIDLKPDIINGLSPQVPDLSNCFCETDKMMRGLGVDSGVKGSRIKNKYTTPNKAQKIAFPPKWGIKENKFL
jgi:hypothetical protein